ncbi:MAG: LysM peptidoglycan-binding domain-containing protein, partial [Anaerolineae bacterium]|nr:LysM peptidoglycan-binding domain-containing protein [Anaerolineae bacterium]
MRRWVSLTLLGILLAWLLLAAAPAHAAELHQGSVIHVVGWGETLFSIARRYGVSVDAICAANGIADPTRIYAGQRLVIPTSDVPAAPAAAGATHVVQAGENLYRIALRYGTTVAALTELNGIYNPGHVAAGQTLVIPG